jgi:hypothetical protein
MMLCCSWIHFLMPDQSVDPPQIVPLYPGNIRRSLTQLNTLVSVVVLATRLPWARSYLSWQLGMWADKRFAGLQPRQEPGAGIPPARICFDGYRDGNLRTV